MNKIVSYNIAKLLKEKGYNGLFGPTIGQVVDWIYEEFAVWISVDYYDEEMLFVYLITSIQEHVFEMEEHGFKTPYEAYEAAITYYLKNLKK